MVRFISIVPFLPYLHLSTKDGQPTGAIKGALNALNKLLKQYQPTHVAVVFDAGGTTFRHRTLVPITRPIAPRHPMI
jgi:5'-3' exonuclease